MRQIVIDAFKCDELVYQFTRIDVEDGILKTGDAEEVNEKYSDEYIIGEAENRKSISGSWIQCTNRLKILLTKNVCIFVSMVSC